MGVPWGPMGARWGLHGRGGSAVAVAITALIKRITCLQKVLGSPVATLVDGWLRHIPSEQSADVQSALLWHM